jgi:hypothetical protein
MYCLQIQLKNGLSKEFPDQCQVIFKYNDEQLAQWLQNPNPFLLIKGQMLDKVKEDLDELEHFTTSVVTARFLPPLLARLLLPLPSLPSLGTCQEMYFDANNVADIGEI